MNKLPVRVAVVCLSMLLVGGYVYLRAGDERHAFDGSKSGRISTSTSTTQQTYILSGSKSAVLTGEGQKIIYGDAAAPTQSVELKFSSDNPRAAPPSTRLSIGPATTLPVFFPAPKSEIIGTAWIGNGSLIRVQATSAPAAPATTQSAKP
jgi:hypothetical protein